LDDAVVTRHHLEAIDQVVVHHKGGAVIELPKKIRVECRQGVLTFSQIARHK